MGRRIPGKLLPHRDLVIVEPYIGGGAHGRQYGEPVTIQRALIIDDEKLLHDQYDSETVLTAIVYFERHEIERIPEPETKVTIWAGTRDERGAHVDGCSRYQHPKVADLLEVRLR